LIVTNYYNLTNYCN